MTSEVKMNLGKRREGAKGRVVKLTHIPEGFYDMEIYQYFSQFGKVKRVRVPRSKKGHFMYTAYVYFLEPEVARIAAESMNNYLMFDKRVRSNVLTDKIPAIILTGPRLIRNHPIGSRALKAQAKQLNAKKSDEDVEKFKEKLADSLDKTMAKLKKAGYKYKFEYRHKL